MLIFRDKIVLDKESGKMEEIVRILTLRNETISTMESATGGFIANAITNVEGASEVFSFGAVTYSNFYKIKFGVSEEVIKKYSVYSMEVAHEMSSSIVNYTGSRYGIGITGKFNREDRFNHFGDNRVVYISVYDKVLDIYVDKVLTVTDKSREKNKENVLYWVINLLKEILKEEE